MRFTWKGVLLAPLAAAVLVSAAFARDLHNIPPMRSFLILLIPVCIISYGTIATLFLPGLFVISRRRRPSGVAVCLSGFVLGAAAYVPVILLAWATSGADLGPPVISLSAYFLRWYVDPQTAIPPAGGLLTAGLYWWLGRPDVAPSASGGGQDQ
jgi:hypothetical protein